MGEAELYHFGIKGMRWGVRRFQNRDGSLTAEGRARLRSYSDKYQPSDFTVKKGSKFQRVGRGNETDDNKRTYVSFGEKDNARYISYYDSLNASHKIELVSKNDLKVAKGKVLVDSYIELLGDKTPSQIIDSRPMTKKDRKEVLNVYKNAVRDQGSFDKSFERFSRDLMNRNNISDEYFNRLKQKGYNAMFDYNDRNAADNPLIVFDRLNNLKTVKISEISTKDIDKALDYLYELDHKQRR